MNQYIARFSPQQIEYEISRKIEEGMQSTTPRMPVGLSSEEKEEFK
jgi:hypothetical protein